MSTAEQPASTGEAGETQQEAIHILVVDDEPDVQDMISLRLRRQIRSGKYRFQYALDGQQAIDMLREQQQTQTPFEMIISDINMPRMDGLALLDHLQRETPDLRTIMVSAYGDIPSIRNAMNRGAFDFVTKPVNFEDLETTIDKTLQSVRQLQEAKTDHQRLTSIQAELNLAAGIQQSILPVNLPNNARYQTFAHMHPAKNVGGDFYDVFTLPEGKIGLAVADVSDKGVPAALYMMATKMTLKALALDHTKPAPVVQRVNTLLTEDNRSTMFVTLLYAVYDPDTGHLAYTNAGHCNPLVIHPDGTASELSPTDGLVIGLMPGEEYDHKTATLMPGETLVIYSDGVTEAVNPEGEQLGMERLRQTFEGGPQPVPPAPARCCLTRRRGSPAELRRATTSPSSASTGRPHDPPAAHGHRHRPPGGPDARTYPDEAQGSRRGQGRLRRVVPDADVQGQHGPGRAGHQHLLLWQQGQSRPAAADADPSHLPRRRDPHRVLRPRTPVQPTRRRPAATR